MAHTASGALHFGSEETKLESVGSFRTSLMFSPAERAALALAEASGQTPSKASDVHFEDLRRHWSEEEIVEIVAAIATTGFVNRWNTTMATPLEDESREVGERHLRKGGRTPGCH